MEEQILYQNRPAIFRNHPLIFLISLTLILGSLTLWLTVDGWKTEIAIPLVLLGGLILLVQWLRKIGTTLTVTDKRTILRKGILSKYTTEIFHSNVRNIQLSQNLFQRIVGIGDMEIASAANVVGAEIVITGVTDPEKVRQLINEHRGSESTSKPSQTDQNRN